MKSLLIFVLLFSGASISEINRLKTEAMDHFDQGSFELAEKKLIYLKDSLGIYEAQVVLNLASSQYLQGKTEQAFNNYKSVAASKDPKHSSQALQQMGVISYETEKYPEALEAFKQSLIKDPENIKSRFNYELVKKKIKEQPQDQKDQDQDQDKDQEKEEEKEKEDQDQQKDQNEKEGEEEKEGEKEEESDEKSEEEKEKESEQEKDSEEKEDQKKEDQKEGEKGEEKEDQKAKPQKTQPDFEDMKISPEVAKMILQAMENREMQYFQQLKKEATKSNNKKSKW